MFDPRGEGQAARALAGDRRTRLRLASPAVRYQTDSARSRGVIGPTPCPTFGRRVNVDKSGQRHDRQELFERSQEGAHLTLRAPDHVAVGMHKEERVAVRDRHHHSRHRHVAVTGRALAAKAGYTRDNGRQAIRQASLINPRTDEQSQPACYPPRRVALDPGTLSANSSCRRRAMAMASL
jgi:hypothetical protein